jgi:hypothetical protein
VAQTSASYSSKYLIVACGFETISWSLMLAPYLCSVLWDKLRSRTYTQINCQDLHREVTGRLQHQNTVINGQWTSKNLVCYKLAPPDPPNGPLPAIALPILNDQYVSERSVTDGGSQWFWEGVRRRSRSPAQHLLNSGLDISSRRKIGAYSVIQIFDHPLQMLQSNSYASANLQRHA